MNAKPGPGTNCEDRDRGTADAPLGLAAPTFMSTTPGKPGHKPAPLQLKATQPRFRQPTLVHYAKPRATMPPVKNGCSSPVTNLGRPFPKLVFVKSEFLGKKTSLKNPKPARF